MLINPKFIKYSDFFIAMYADPDTEKYGLKKKYYDRHNYYAADTLLPKHTGMFGLMRKDDLNPIYHNQKERWDDIHIPKIASRLNRNRYLSNKKNPYNENYRKLFHPRHIFRSDFPDTDAGFDQYIDTCSKNKDVSITTYGTCDTPEQIYSRLNFLDRIKDRNFMISVGYVKKDDLKDGESSYGGYRQHKNGGYYGTKLLEHEYLADEESIKGGIFSFQIHEIKDTKKDVYVENDFIFVKFDSRRPNQHNYWVFDKNDDCSLITYIQSENSDKFYIGNAVKQLKFYNAEDFNLSTLNDDLLEMVNAYKQTMPRPTEPTPA